MQDHPTGHEQAHEDRDPGQRQAELLGKDRAHGEKRAMGDRDRHAAEDAERRNAVELEQADRGGGVEVGGRGRGQRDRHQGERDQDRDQDERDEAQRVGDVEQQLAAGHAAEHDDHIDRQQLTAVLVGAAGVQPALGDDVKAGVGEPGDQSYRHPGDRIDEDDMEQGRSRGQRGQGGEDPDMADPLDDLRRQGRAGEEADEIARHDDPGDRRREAFHGRPQRQQRALQPVAQHHQSGAQ